jgi:ABC-type transporter Mla maintaining outer membrane lipid asymmetry ATPase subunit MlaF
LAASESESESGTERADDARAEILAFDDVSVGYENEVVLHDITFNVRRGEVAGLVALDGRGKSTLIRCAAGLLAPVRGRVLYEQRNVYAMSFAEDQRFRARTAAVFEGGALFQNRSIIANVTLPIRYHLGTKEGEADEHGRRLLERVGYHESLAAFPWQVSARGRRLAALARALVREPELVIIDRFFEALEAQDQKRVFELVLELNVKNGTSFLIVGELQPAIFQVAERVLVLEGGRKVAHGFRRGLYKDARIKAAFETGVETAPEGYAPHEPLPPPAAAAPPEPLEVGAASEGFDPNASDSDLQPVIVTPDPDVPSADEMVDSDDGETATIDEEAARALIALARRRAEERIAAESESSGELDRKALEAARRLNESDALASSDDVKEHNGGEPAQGPPSEKES